MKDQKIKEISIEGNYIKVTILISKEKVFGADRLLNYDDQSRMKNDLIRLIAEEILKDKKEDIIKEVLKEVNWPDVVRSEIAQKVIKEIAKSY